MRMKIGEVLTSISEIKFCALLNPSLPFQTEVQRKQNMDSTLLNKSRGEEIKRKSAKNVKFNSQIISIYFYQLVFFYLKFVNISKNATKNALNFKNIIRG